MPACVQCKYHIFPKPDEYEEWVECTHPKALHPVTGQQQLCERVREDVIYGTCGLEGKYFEPKESPQAESDRVDGLHGKVGHVRAELKNSAFSDFNTYANNYKTLTDAIEDGCQTIYIHGGEERNGEVEYTI